MLQVKESNLSAFANEITNPIKNWKQLPMENIAETIRKFIPLAEDNYSGNPDQFNRVQGINFGHPTQGFIDDIINPNLRAVNVHLGVVESLHEKKICLILETKIKGRSTSNYYISNEEDNGRFYDNQFINSKGSQKHSKFGISREFANQLNYSWTNSNILPQKFFYSFNPKKDNKVHLPVIHSSKVMNNFSWTRVHYFPIFDHNDVFKKLFTSKSSSNLGIRIFFGVNYSDFFVDQELFTIIIEVEDTSKDEKTYLDFVKACPPNCD